MFLLFNRMLTFVHKIKSQVLKQDHKDLDALSERVK